MGIMVKMGFQDFLSKMNQSMNKTPKKKVASKQPMKGKHNGKKQPRNSK